MDAFASPSIRPDGPLRGGLRAAGTVLLGAALGLSLVRFSGAPNTSLDASWQLMLVHAHSIGLQFGRDVVFTWGPWGFLCNMYHFGSTGAVPILAWQTAGQFLVAFSLVALTRGLVLWRRIAFVALIGAFHWIFLDVEYFALITLVVLCGLLPREASLPRMVAWTLLLGFVAQFKFTYFALGTAGVLAAMACWASRGSWRRAWAVAAGYVAAAVGAWVAAGQNPVNLYPYLRRSLDVALGYGDAMGVDESLPTFLWGTALVVLCAAFLWCAWRSVPERALAHCACAFLAFSLFAMWKEGFVRADGHVYGWYIYVLVLAPLVPGILLPGRRLHWFDGAPLVCIAAIACCDPVLCGKVPLISWQRAVVNAQLIGRIGDLPREWKAAYEQASAGAQLPRVKAAVGGGTVDVYDFNTDIAFMNGLNLDSRPVFQGYTAYTPGLEALNLRHYRSGRAPDFLLWNGDRIDNRYPGQDDAMMVSALPGHFEPLFQEGGYWLFRRTSEVPKAWAERRLLIGRTVRLSEEIVLPAGRDHAIWLQADAVPAVLGRLRALLYKPPEIQISVTDDQGKATLWRLVPRVASAGFLLVPTLAAGDDAAALMRGRTRSWVRSFHFEAPAGQGGFWSRVVVQVFGIPSIPLVSESAASDPSPH
jgi:hypothetical protein